MLIQIVILIFLLFVISRLVLRYRERRISFLSLIIWLIFWVLVAVVVIWPESANRLADILGVGRGADAIVYFALLAIFYFIFRILIKFEQIEREIATLVRKISFLEKGKESDKNL